MLRLPSFAILFATLLLLGCSDSATSVNDGNSSSEPLDASSSMLSSAKKTSSGALSSYASSTIAPSSSSSSEKASSGSNVYWNQSISYGVLTDARDKRNYRTTQIGTQNWMVENLNFTAKVGESRCYDAKTANCTKYGRLYNWEAASASCPESWHLPDSSEWNQLAKLLGGASAAGKILKASTPLWTTNTGNDAFGFAALPSGSYDNDQYYDMGTAGLWWTSSELNSTTAYYRDIIGTANSLRVGSEKKMISIAVRCIQDKEVPASSSVPQSSSEVTSSSVAPSSSSVAAITSPDRSCTYVEASPATTPATGNLTCPNNEAYKTVTIGSAVWMAQNLNYGTLVSNPKITSQSIDSVIEKFCYGDMEANCTSDGAFYQWAEAMGFKYSCNSVLLNDPTCNAAFSSTNHQGICPTGWHMPKASDWDALIYALDSDSGTVGATMKLNNTTYSNWNSFADIRLNNGNSSGFSALPSGWCGPLGFDGRGTDAIFREASEKSAQKVYFRGLSKSDTKLSQAESYKTQGFSVRCVKDP